MTRLIRFLTCYNPNIPLAIGERYGFQLWNSFHGYEYLTGGAGVALSAPLVHEMIKLGKCDCPSPTTPDDMYLFGICLARIGIQPIHSSMFHQVCYVKLFIFYIKKIYFRRFLNMISNLYTGIKIYIKNKIQSLLTVKLVVLNIYYMKYL